MADSKTLRAIKTCLEGMDASDNSQWTKEGKPRMTYVEEAVGDTGITREDLTEAWGGVFTRETLRAKELEADAPETDESTDATDIAVQAVTDPENQPHQGGDALAQLDAELAGADTPEEPVPAETTEDELAAAQARALGSTEGVQQAGKGDYDAKAANAVKDAHGIMRREAPVVGTGMLLGSDLLAPETRIGDKDVSAGDIVRAAFALSGMTEQAWNDLGGDVRNQRVADYVEFAKRQAGEPHTAASVHAAKYAPDKHITEAPQQEEQRPMFMPPEWGAGPINPKAGPMSRSVVEGDPDVAEHEWYMVWMEQRIYAIERTTNAAVLVFPPLGSGD